MAELSLWLDSYNDIYSDFDNRNFIRRRISDDFLQELRMELKYTGQPLTELILLLPPQLRIPEQESQITRSLVETFRLRYFLYRARCRKKIRSILLLSVSGAAIVLLNSWISFRTSASFFTTGLRVILEPAGWFLIWAAFDFLFYDLPLLKKEKELYKVLAEMKCSFRSS